MVTPVNSVPPQPSPPPLLATRGDVAVSILSSTIDPSTLQPPATIAGNVTAVARDGSVTIQTNAGDVVVQPDARVTIRVGQSVALDIASNGTTTISAQSSASSTSTPGSSVNVPTTPSTDASDLTATLRDLVLQTTTNPATPSLPPQIGDTVQMRAITMSMATALITPTTTVTTTSLPLFDMSPFGNIPGAVLTPKMMMESLFTSTGDIKAPIFTAPTDTSTSPLNLQGRLALNAPDDIDAFFSRTMNTNMTAQYGNHGMSPDLTMTRFAPGGVLLSSVGGAPRLSLPTNLIMTPSALPRAFENSLMVLGSTGRGAMIIADISDVSRPPFFLTTQNTAAPLPPGTIMTGIPNGAAVFGLLGASPQGLTSALLQDILAALPMSMAQTLFGPSARPPLPSTGAPTQMAAAITLFIAAVRSGDLSGILDDQAMDMLRRIGKGDALDQLTDTIGALKTRADNNAAQPGEWRSYMFPLQFQGPVMPVMLHMKSAGLHDNDQHDAHQGQGGQRFVIDLTFDRMGMVQLDMLYQPGKLDSVLRTELPISMAMRGVLEAKYAGAMNRVSHTGELHFQDGLKHWVMVDQGQEQVRVTA